MKRTIITLIVAGIALASCMSAADMDAARRWVGECRLSGFTMTQCEFLARHFTAGSVGIGTALDTGEAQR